MMTARLAEDATPVVRPADVATPSLEPEPVGERPVVEPSPSYDELPTLVDTDQAAPEASAAWHEAPEPTGAPVALPGALPVEPAVAPAATPAVTAAPLAPPGDIAEQLARELGIALPHQDTVPGSFASVDDVETPHWKAVMDRIQADAEDPPPV
jgi:hypothetical protein